VTGLRLCGRGIMMIMKWAGSPKCPFCDGMNTTKVGTVGKGLWRSLFGK
jgi:hypothetical protein